MSHKAQSDYATISRNIFITGLGILFQRFSKFLIVILQIKYLGLEAYGLFVLCLSYILILGTLQTMGLRCLVKYGVQFRLAKQSGLLWAIYWASIVVPIFTGTIISGIAITITFFLDITATTAQTFIFFLFFLPFVGSADVPLFMTTSFETNFYISCGRDILSPIIEIVLLFTFLFFDFVPSSVHVVICIYVAAKVPLYVLATYFFSKLCSRENISSYHGFLENMRLLRTHAQEVKNAVVYCIPLLGGNIFVRANDLVDVLLLGMLTNNTLTGIYQLAKSLSNIIASVSSMTLNMLASITSKHYQTKNYMAIQLVYLHSAKLSLFIGLPALAIFISFPEQILSVFNKDAVLASFALQLLLIGQGSSLLARGFNIILSMTDKAYLHALNSSLGAIINVTLCYFFIQMWSLNGAALATTISLLIVNLLRTVQVFYFYKIHFFCRFTFAVTILCLFTTIMLHLVKNSFSINIIMTFGLTIVCYMFMWGISWYLIMDTEEKQKIMTFK